MAMDIALPSAQDDRTQPELLAERAHQALIAQLCDGHLRSGSFLSVPALVERLGLPIAAVRDAVKRAEAAELLVIMPKRGIMVMESSPAITRECLDLRAILDCEGARRLVRAGLPDSFAKLRQAHESLRDRAIRAPTPELPPQAIATDLSLHDALSEGLDSRLARRIYAENRVRIAVIQNTRPFLADRIVSAMNEHLDIITALEAGDAEGACAAIGHHLVQTLRWWGITEQGDATSTAMP